MMQGLNYNFDEMFPEEPDFYEDEEMCMKDYEYMKRLYPREVRMIAGVLEDSLDKWEYEGSPMYAQYPDAVTIYRLAKEIYDKFSFECDEKEKRRIKDMIEVMVCQEMYIRRRRHDKFCRKWMGMR